ncbi:MAG TPA: M13 family peptidase, partial [Alphaproteobacteria bacterium]|nr:M13 family peptidase [Alphaproteobacteria bacterium]
MKTKWLGGVCAALLLAACSQPAETPTENTDDTAVDTVTTDDTTMAEGAPRLGDFGVETQHISETVDPGDDFFTYVNEGWLNSAELPQGFSSLGAFTELYLEAEERVNGIIREAAAAGGQPGSPEYQIGALYESYMNTDRIEELGLTPLQAEIDQVMEAQTHEDIARWMGRPIHQSIVGLGVTIDPGNPERYVISTGQNGLGLPDRDYYLNEDDPFPGHRDAYVDYIEATLARAGFD